MADLQKSVRSDFSGKRIVIAGDLVADQFLGGTISRVSREAPVFILRHDKTVTLPGAAANAAANVAALGGRPVVIGLVGNDANGRLLLDKLREMDVATEGVITEDSISTTTKVRVLAGQHYAARQQVIRIDYENAKPVSGGIRQRLADTFAAAIDDADAIIISDYGCGVVSRETFDTAVTGARKRDIPLLVDSRHHLLDLPGATTATPNREEVEMILGENFTAEDCASLRDRLGYNSLLVTNGNQGMLLVEKDRPPLLIDAVGSKEPVDVTGAGDTVIAAYGLGLAAGLSFADAARIANHAGGIVVMKKGTSVVTVEELCESLRTNGASHAHAT